MGTIRIKAKEFVTDIQSAMDDASMMAKYGLSSEQLQRIFDQLIQMGLISENDLRVRASISETQITRAFVEAQVDVRTLE